MNEIALGPVIARVWRQFRAVDRDEGAYAPVTYREWFALLDAKQRTHRRAQAAAA